MANSTYGPKLIVNTTSSASTFGMLQVFRETYTGADGVEYIIAAVHNLTSANDSIYAIKRDKTVTAGFTYTEVVTSSSAALTKNKRYTFAKHMDRVYYTNGTDAIGWMYCNTAGTWSVGTMTNAPKSTIIIEAKSALWASGETDIRYSTGTALFTQSSKTVTGTGTTWTEWVQAGDLIGTGASPSTFYVVASVESDTVLYLTENFAESTTSNTSYLNKRIVNRFVYWSAEEATNDWELEGIYGGFSAGSLMVNDRVTGLHKYDDAVLIFTKFRGFFIEGINPDDWTIPKNTRLPVGCVSHDSIISKENFLGWLSEKGYYVSSGNGLRFSDLQGSAYSEKISAEVADIDPEVWHLVKSFVYKDSLYISVPASSVFSESDTNLSYSTGTVSVSNGSTSVTGSGTAWRGRIQPNDQIRFNSEVDSAGNALYYTVSAITSDTAITLDRNKSGAVSGVTYKIRKRRNNRILVLDTRTNIEKQSYGWTVFDNVNSNGFAMLGTTLLYGSSTNGALYQFDTGGTLYGTSFSASATTARTDVGLPKQRKDFMALKQAAKGVGTLTITPYVDGVAKTAITYSYGDSTNYVDVYFPRDGQPFRYVGNEIYLKYTLSGSNETLEILPPEYGFLPRPIGT